MKRTYDSTVARIAGNIASGLMVNRDIERYSPEFVARIAVRLARLIVENTERTEDPAARDRMS